MKLNCCVVFVVVGSLSKAYEGLMYYNRDGLSTVDQLLLLFARPM